jgi:hypothetical protein
MIFMKKTSKLLMITYLSSPKPFIGIAKEHQYNAIRSWKKTCVDAEVILYGDSDGIDEAGRELGVKVVKQINCSSSGIPYFGSIVCHADINAKYDFQIYLNCDILLYGILQAMSEIDFPQFLIIGQLIDLEENLFIDVASPDFRQVLWKLANNEKVSLRGPSGIDYFGFRRGTFNSIPPVVIGRAGYDSAVLAYSLQHKIPIIDVTFAVIALHQCHDYAHVAGGKQTVWHGIDAQNNLFYAGSHSLPSISDASYVLKGTVVTYLVCRGDWLRQFELIIRYRLRWSTISLGVRLIWRILQSIGISRAEVLNLFDVIGFFPEVCTSRNMIKQIEEF